ncbi:MAG TPA: peptidylprolyl isomerase [Acetobacteraceae bacterium]
MSFRLGAVARLAALGLAAALPVSGASAQTAPPAPSSPGAVTPGGATPGATAAEAATPPDQPAVAPSVAPGKDPVVATVNQRPIHLSDVAAAATTLPPNLRAMPEQVLYPMLLDRLVDQEALADEAQRTGFDKNPEVERQMKLAERAALQRAFLIKEVQPEITDAAVHARYEKDIANKPPVEEVHAKHILVDSEAQAKDIITQLKAGADFDTLAKKYSKDASGTQGDDLGFFKQSDMVPEFAAAAFAMQPGQFSQTPVHTQFGWHVIKVIERRQDKPQTFEAAKDELRQHMAQEAAEKVVADAVSHVKVQKFNLDGTPIAAKAPPTPPPAK